MLGERPFDVRAFRNQNSMVTWFTNSRSLKERMFFSFQFRKIITRYRRIGYNLNVMRQSACLILTQSWLITMLPSLIARRWVGRQTLLLPRLKAIHFSWLGPERLVCCLAHRGSTGVFLLLRVSVSYSGPRALHRRAVY